MPRDDDPDRIFVLCLFSLLLIRCARSSIQDGAQWEMRNMTDAERVGSPAFGLLANLSSCLTSFSNLDQA